ncbi:MAG: DUF5107 domain-containing protein [Rikenellaceae bacterium]
MKKNLCLIFIVVSCVATINCAFGQTTFSQRGEIMKTYGYSDPDPIANPAKPIYPYFRFDGFTSEGSDQQWQVVELENQYIKVKITPEIGGKIWGAIEKQSGHDFIYDNDVVKFRDIAMRGPWVSGGIEINFGIIGHAPWSSSPVDYIVRENNDGSVSCIVGTLDLVTRAWWSCEIKLESDKAYFTTSTKWYNPTLLSKPYYHWMNAGYDQTEQMGFYFPGDTYIGHNGNNHSWPYDSEGRDISKYSENNFGSSKSYHITGATSDYYAAYWPENEFGSVHYSPYGEKLGMKIFLWGLARSGMIWEDLLTDNSGQYVELQSGRLFNQETDQSANTPFKHFTLQGAACESFTEYWYPIKNTKGVLTTNKYATVNITIDNSETKFHISPLQAINDKVTIKNNGKIIFQQHLSLQPMESFESAIEAVSDGELEVVIGDNLLVYSQEYVKPTSRPREIEKSFDKNSLYGRYVSALQHISVKHYDVARGLLESVLAEDSNYAPALNSLSSIYIFKGEYKKAKELALKSLSIDTYDADANLMYGLSSGYLGESVDAIDGYAVASLSSSHRVAAYIGLAKEYAKRAMWERVVEYCLKIDALERGNSDAAQMLCVAYRKMGSGDMAAKTIAQLELFEPLNHFARFEKYMLTHSSVDEFIAAVRSELKHEIFLEMGIWYESLGLTCDALELYEVAGNHPQILFHKAYNKYLLGQDDALDVLAMANEASAEFVFPFRYESLELFEWAAKTSDSWKSKYYLALLKWHLGDKETAEVLLDELGNTPDYAPFYITRSMLKEGEDCLADLLKSESLEESWRIGSLLIKEYKKQGLIEQMMSVATKYKKLYGDDFRLGMAYVPVLIQTKQYKAALKYLENVEIIPYEGANEGRTMYRDCNLYMALEALEKERYSEAIEAVERSFIWIENLGVGKPYDEDIDNRTENYILAYCYSKLGDPVRASALYREVADYTKFNNSNTILTLLSLRSLGEQAKAEELLGRYLEKNNNKQVAQWAEFIYNGELEKADSLFDSSNTQGQIGIFGANNFNDYNFISIVKEVVKLKIDNNN